MTIRNYTFFSPNGTEFPVSANADAKLYMLMAGNDYSQFIIKHWSEPTLTGLNKVYTDTSVLLGGRYFELNGEPVPLNANAINYIHANIDPSNVTIPVTISVETSINSNSNDINSGNGVIKRLIDIVTTDATKVTKSQTPEQGRNFDRITTGNVQQTLPVNKSIAVGWGKTLNFTRVGNVVTVTGEGTFTSNMPQTAWQRADEKIPVGFRPVARQTIRSSAIVNERKYMWTRFNTDGSIQHWQNGSIVVADTIVTNGTSWVTIDPFPTN